MKRINNMRVNGLIIILLSLSPTSIWAFDSRSVLSDSVRQQLVETSRRINPASGYASPGWSNRAATVLTPVAEGVYTADRPFYWNNIDVSCRSTVIELPSTRKGEKPDLWVHSPVALDGPMNSLIQNLGNVKYVVSPNYEHLKFAPQWYQGFPDAQMWGCPGLAERMENIQFTGEIPTKYRPANWKQGSTFDDTSVIGWDTSVIQALHIDVEVNPLTGKPFFNEVIFYHVPSKTLIATDFYWNYPADSTPNSQFGRDDTWELAPQVDSVPLGSRLWKLGMDKVYAPFYNQFMVQDKNEYRAIVDHVLNVWDVEVVIPAHGDILRGKGFIRDVLSKHFGV